MRTSTKWLLAICYGFTPLLTVILIPTLIFKDIITFQQLLYNINGDYEGFLWLFIIVPTMIFGFIKALMWATDTTTAPQLIVHIFEVLGEFIKFIFSIILIFLAIYLMFIFPLATIIIILLLILMSLNK